MKYIVSASISLLWGICLLGDIKVSLSLAASASANLTVRTAGSGTSGNSFQHVVIVVEENTDYSSINATNTPYINSLATIYGVATQFYANTHPSIGNYFAQTAGTIITNDDNQTPTSAPLFPYNGDNIVRHLNNAGKSWKVYAESIPS